MTREVWVFLPVRHSSEVGRVRAVLIEECKRRGWTWMERPTHAENGRAVVDGEDAGNVYRRMHAMRVAVLSVQHPNEGGPQILARPKKYGISWRDAFSLRYLCRHKAFFRRLRCDRDLASWAASFDAWAG